MVTLRQGQLLCKEMVNFSGISIESETIVSFLKRQVQLKETCQTIVYQQIIERTAQERGIAVTPEEIQAEADRLRYEMRLESAAATFAWLEEQLITPEEWEAGIRDRLLKQKLAESLFAHEIERYFVQNRLDFEQILLYKIVVPYEQLAQELFYQIEENEISFYEAAHLYDVDEQRRLKCGYEGKLYRHSFAPEVAAIVFSSRLAEVIGPVQSDAQYELLLIEEFIAAELTDATRKKIIDRLFAEWIESELNYLIHHETPIDLSDDRSEL
jgi:parvulin-like peptidyl-prolyl isomerase